MLISYANLNRIRIVLFIARSCCHYQFCAAASGLNMMATVMTASRLGKGHLSCLLNSCTEHLHPTGRGAAGITSHAFWSE